MEETEEKKTAQNGEDAAGEGSPAETEISEGAEASGDGEETQADPAAESGENARNGEEEEPAVKDGEKGKSKKGGKKLILLIVPIGIAVVAAGVGAAVLLPKFMEKKKQEEAVTAPAFYFSKKDAVSSVTEVLGERRFERLFEEASADGTASESQDGAQEPETEDGSAQETEGESAEAVMLEVYQYFPEEDVETDVQGYLEYLLTEKNFIDITDVVEARAAQEAETESEDAGKEAEPSEEEGPVYYQLAGPAADEDSYLMLSVTQYPDCYQIRTQTGEQSWTQYMAGLWEEREEQRLQQQAPQQTAENVPTRQYLEEKIAGMSREELNLSEETDNYEFISSPGSVYVDETEYFRVMAYHPNEAGTLDYVCTYLLDAAGEVRYTYNEVTGEKEPLK